MCECIPTEEEVLMGEPTSMPRLSPQTRSCRSCKAPIYLALLESGRWMPVDVAPSSSGTIVLSCSADGVVYARVLRAGEDPPDGGTRRASHFVTCPNASRHRRRRSDGKESR